MIVQTLPFHSSASESFTPEVGSRYALTATQKLGLVHEMPRRPFADPPRLGLGVSDQLAGAAAACGAPSTTVAKLVRPAIQQITIESLVRIFIHPFVSADPGNPGAQRELWFELE